MTCAGSYHANEQGSRGWGGQPGGYSPSPSFGQARTRVKSFCFSSPPMPWGGQSDFFHPCRAFEIGRDLGWRITFRWASCRDKTRASASSRARQQNPLPESPAQADRGHPLPPRENTQEIRPPPPTAPSTSQRGPCLCFMPRQGKENPLISFGHLSSKDLDPGGERHKHPLNPSQRA